MEEASSSSDGVMQEEQHVRSSADGVSESSGIRTVAEDAKEKPSSGPVRRARRSDPDAASRGRRMFGLLNSTLNKAKEDNAKRSSGEAARKRADLEARLQEKLKTEGEHLRANKELSERLQAQMKGIYELALEVQAKDAAIRTRKAQKRRMASFLVTSSELAEYDGQEARATSVDGRVLAPDVALTLAPIGPQHPTPLKRPDSHPVYFLPKHMTAQQDDKLDEQEDRVDVEIDESEMGWAKSKAELQDRLELMKDAAQKTKKELLKLEGDGLEVETRAGAALSQKDGDVEMNQDTQAEGSADTEKGVVAMDAEPLSRPEEDCERTKDAATGEAIGAGDTDLPKNQSETKPET